MANKLQSELAKGLAWRDAFRANTIRVGFSIMLTRPMCEFLSAVADDVDWDRSKFGGAQAYPDNALATAAALVKRGLILPKPGRGQPGWLERQPADLYSFSLWVLSPAGQCIVELLKHGGMYVEADAAIEKKHAKK
jgi:hypothetical protein